MNAETLRKRWDAHPNWKRDWLAVLDSQMWQHLVTMLREEAMLESRSFRAGFDSDTLLARKLVALDAAESLIAKLQQAAVVKKEESPEDDPDAKYRHVANEVYGGPIE